LISLEKRARPARGGLQLIATKQNITRLLACIASRRIRSGWLGGAGFRLQRELQLLRSGLSGSQIKNRRQQVVMTHYRRWIYVVSGFFQPGWIEL